MHSKPQPGALTELLQKAAAIARCTSFLAGLLIAHTALIANTVDIATDRPVSSNALINVGDTRLEIYRNRRQAILYRGNTPLRRYPIGTGRHGWETPTGTFRVMQMKRNPAWINPFTNERIAPNNPRNPLRGYWIGFWTNGTNWIGFHGTLDANSVGKASSHGCIHMYDSDLKDLFSQVSLGTQVKVLP